MRGWKGDPAQRRGYHHGNLREALVQVAQRFIGERGIGGFTLVDAAKLVGVSPAALYRHFQGRDELVAEIASRGFADLGKRLSTALSGSGTPLERFTRMGEAYLDFAETEPGYYAAMFAPRRPGEDSGPSWAQRTPDGAKTTHPDAMELLVKALTQTFPEGFHTDTRFIALEVWALSHGLATLSSAGHLPRGPGLPDARELMRAGVLAIVTGAKR